MNAVESFELYKNYLCWIPWKSDTELTLLGEFRAGIQDMLERRIQSVTHISHHGNHIDDRVLPTTITCFLIQQGINFCSSQESLQKLIHCLLQKRGGSAFLVVCTNNENGEAKVRLENFFQINGFCSHFFYIYPDIDACKYIFTDDFLPVENMISVETWFNRKEDYDETIDLRESIREGEFASKIRQFLCVAWKDTVPWKAEEFPRQVTFSNLRDRSASISTMILRECVEKTALWPEGKLHIRKYFDHASALQLQYSSARIQVPVCRMIDCCHVRSKFVSGCSLRSILDEMYHLEDSSFFSWISDYTSRIKMANNNAYFNKSSGFISWFGDMNLPSTLRSGTYNNIDLIFDNIIITPSNEWFMIDCEWVTDFPVPNEFLLFRALFYYFSSLKKGNQYRKWLMNCQEIASIPRDRWEIYERMEKNFQRRLTGDIKVEPEDWRIYKSIGKITQKQGKVRTKIIHSASNHVNRLYERKIRRRAFYGVDEKNIAGIRSLIMAEDLIIDAHQLRCGQIWLGHPIYNLEALCGLNEKPFVIILKDCADVRNRLASYGYVEKVDFGNLDDI